MSTEGKTFNRSRVFGVLEQFVPVLFWCYPVFEEVGVVFVGGASRVFARSGLDCMTPLSVRQTITKREQHVLPHIDVDGGDDIQPFSGLRCIRTICTGIVLVLPCFRRGRRCVCWGRIAGFRPKRSRLYDAPVGSSNDCFLSTSGPGIAYYTM